MATASSAVLVALGANLGDPVAQIRWASGELARRSIAPLRRSSLWVSTPVDCPPDSPTFVNAVVQLVPVPGETPESFLGQLKSLEIAAGRRPKQVHNEARPLDLDLIAWGSEVRDTPELILPHPRASQRRFVLAPLAELVPGFILAGETRSVQELLALAPPDPLLRRLEDPGLFSFPGAGLSQLDPP